ncbi:PilZ domain-containing protein [Corallincola platygyrae]|uniref:PilZ domain-containing protein n=1 Tax=Corallincola platygyrae TaxID=1193278 RepID=A0ABW4XPQ4_9GAMM
MSNKQADSITERAEIVQTLSQMRPGNVLDFQLAVGVKPRFKCKLVGYEEGRYMALSIPAQSRVDHDELLVHGYGCIVRTIIEGEAGQCIAFKSLIQTNLRQPHPVLFIDYPKQIQLYSLRNQTRIATHVPATMIGEQKDESTGQTEQTVFHGTIVDLSVGGCRLKLPWPLGQPRLRIKDVLLKVVFPSQPDEPLLLDGEIKSENRHDGRHITVGIQFDEVPALVELFDKIGIDKADVDYPPVDLS